MILIRPIIKYTFCNDKKIIDKICRTDTLKCLSRRFYSSILTTIQDFFFTFCGLNKDNSEYGVDDLEINK